MSRIFHVRLPKPSPESDPATICGDHWTSFDVAWEKRHESGRLDSWHDRRWGWSDPCKKCAEAVNQESA